MFHGAISFTQPFAGWDVSKVVYMGGMFSDAVVFDSPLADWDVSKVEDMDDTLERQRTGQGWNGLRAQPCPWSGPQPLPPQLEGGGQAVRVGPTVGCRKGTASVDWRHALAPAPWSDHKHFLVPAAPAMSHFARASAALPASQDQGQRLALYQSSYFFLILRPFE
jgi:hypothetical protein